MSSFSSSWDVREVAPRCDRDLRDKPSTSQPGAPATDNQHYRGPAAKAPDVRPKNADPRAEGRFHARSQGARPVSELQIEVLKADTRERRKPSFCADLELQRTWPPMNGSFSPGRCAPGRRSSSACKPARSRPARSSWRRFGQDSLTGASPSGGKAGRQGRSGRRTS
jgi:hypothetical protein